MKSFYFMLTACLLWLNFTSLAQDFDIYVSGGGNHAVIKYDQNGENPETFIAPGTGGLSWPQDIVFLERENAVLVSSFNNRSIKKYNADTGEFIENFAALTARPTRMIIRPDSLLYVLQWGAPGAENPVLRYSLDGALVDEYTDVGVATAIGMDWDADDNFYVSSYGSGYVRKYNSEGQEQGFFINSNLAGPTNIWFDDNGDLLVVDYNAGNVKRFNADGVYQDIFIGGLSAPEGVAFLPDGNLMIGNGSTHKVKLFDSEGVFIRDLPTTGVNLSTPNAVVIRYTAPISSIPKVEAKEAILVHPNIGTNFSLLPHHLTNMETVEIYDISGTLIEKKAVNKAQIWNAKQAAEGMYFIVAKTSKGDIFTQKVVVKR